MSGGGGDGCDSKGNGVGGDVGDGGAMVLVVVVVQ